MSESKFMIGTFYSSRPKTRPRFNSVGLDLQFETEELKRLSRVYHVPRRLNGGASILSQTFYSMDIAPSEYLKTSINLLAQEVNQLCSDTSYVLEVKASSDPLRPWNIVGVYSAFHIKSQKTELTSFLPILEGKGR